MITDLLNGQGIIDILSDGFVTCLKIRKPVALDWYDCGGSVAKYYTFTSDYEKVAIPFNEVLTSGNDEQVMNSIATFLQLFAPGKYKVTVNRGVEGEYALHSNFSKSPDHKYYDYGYYNPVGPNLLFTQPLTIMQAERIAWYEELIQKGVRPKAVVFDAVFTNTGIYPDGYSWISTVESSQFILDGHHKLLAYQNLGIAPHFVCITKEAEGKPEFERNERLYFEYEYFLTDNWRKHIICHVPQVVTGNAAAAVQYNIHFDNYLQTASSIETEVLKLFNKAHYSNDPQQGEWLSQKLGILEKRLGEKPAMQLRYYEPTGEYPVITLWHTVYVNSKSDFEFWKEKLLAAEIKPLW